MSAERSIAARVRQAHQQRIPYLAVLGERELADGTTAIRARDGQRITVDTSELARRLVELAHSRTPHLNLVGDHG